MKRAAAILAFCASAAWANPRSDIYHDPTPQDAWFARIVIENTQSTSTHILTFETEHGPVVVRYKSTSCITEGTDKCADSYEVMEAPDGIFVSPGSGWILETETAQIFLYEYRGG